MTNYFSFPQLMMTFDYIFISHFIATASDIGWAVHKDITVRKDRKIEKRREVDKKGETTQIIR